MPKGDRWAEDLAVLSSKGFPKHETIRKGIETVAQAAVRQP